MANQNNDLYKIEAYGILASSTIQTKVDEGKVILESITVSLKETDNNDSSYDSDGNLNQTGLDAAIYALGLGFFSCIVYGQDRGFWDENSKVESLVKELSNLVELRPNFKEYGTDN